ncbi:MAG: Crp/Fnr family transcriptional regulator [Nitrosomonas sp.]|uniref:Crp/Fnr family transcriptional regulator n=1 Tax=Nitrosomonas sp. TaxID=42353 RepID=UPI0025E79019|nr:Crp/Fnr family transcriptional regulator [Nitrosomonas sp.]MBY0475423.1 Crp/Fnr family transcriptional regulator [Nitrosomonas sp.]
MTSTVLPCNNKLLNTLPESDFTAVMDQCRLVNLTAGEVIYESSEYIESIHFPVNCIVSLMYETLDGKSSEIASIGNNGAVGSDLILSNSPTIHRALVVHDGWAYQMKRTAVLDQFNKAELFKYQLLNYIQNLTTQISFNAVCARFHKIEQQFCKFLLLHNDWVPGKISFTQEAISHLLGVRRETITEIASNLQKANIIDYKRGEIHILDRQALEVHSCECYQAIKNTLHSEDENYVLDTCH